jgi:hypothetical protein
VTKQQVKQMLHTEEETKYSTVNLGATNVTEALAVSDVTSIAQGDAGTQRDGNNIRVKAIKLKTLTTRITNDAAVRYIIVQWLVDSTTDALSSLAELFTDTANPVTSAILPLQPSKFRVLLDRTLVLTSSDAMVKFSWQAKTNIKVGFTPGGNTGINHIYFFYVDNRTSTYPLLDANVEVEYTDD